MPPTLAVAATLEFFQSLLTLPLTQQLLMVPLFSPAMPPTRRELLLTLPLTLQLLMVPVPVFLPVMPPKYFSSLLTLALTEQFSIVPLFSPQMPPTRSVPLPSSIFLR